jgi:hypothetical protein
VTSSMAAAAEAMRIRRNISVLLLREESRGHLHIATNRALSEASLAGASRP